ncbi:hypothetical protein AB205_0027870 [Aquarana catesbeiana]|uniref:Uncharacterized protein n=1 Tax=Aquarana catesbeiana TaxID=8400 RepID=A0A2G9PW17_AQUCT|nr:hypothetical protein AB205_0027870 [Aquarana catesbeiana]
MWVLEFLTLGFTTRQLYWIKLKKLWNMDSLQPWTQIETGALTQNPSSILAAVWMGYHQPRFHLPTVNATITTWKSILQASAGLHIQALQQLPILAFKPISLVLPFNQLKDRFNIPNREFYLYLRLRHILTTIPTSHNTLTRDVFAFLHSTQRQSSWNIPPLWVTTKAYTGGALANFSSLGIHTTNSDTSPHLVPSNPYLYNLFQEHFPLGNTDENTI